MQEQFNRHISKNIQNFYRKRLICPILYLLFTLALFQIFPVLSVISPAKLTHISNMEQQSQKNQVYVSATLSHLKFTGYTKSRFHRVIGYYYYMENKEKRECSIILLTPNACEQGLPEIETLTVYGKILSVDASFTSLLEHLSDDLNWTDSGIQSKVTPYYLSEPDFCYGFGIFLFLLLAGSALYAGLQILFFLSFILRPDFSPPCRKLGHFGKPKELLAQAEKELATLPQLATEDMFITERFFIETSKYGIAIVPIEEIIWIYKHSTLHKLFWRHFNISYTLNITANNHVYIHCPKNIKSDIDGIIDYLSEANHAILVGFSEENRQKIHAMQKSWHFRKKRAAK